MLDGSSRDFRVSWSTYHQYEVGQSGVAFYKGIFLKRFHTLSAGAVPRGTEASQIITRPE